MKSLVAAAISVALFLALSVPSVSWQHSSSKNQTFTAAQDTKSPSTQYQSASPTIRHWDYSRSDRPSARDIPHRDT
jgi:hypothetical protein